METNGTTLTSLERERAIKYYSYGWNFQEITDRILSNRNNSIKRDMLRVVGAFISKQYNKQAYPMEFYGKVEEKMKMNEMAGIKAIGEREKEITKAKAYSHNQKGLRTILSLAKEEPIDGVSLCQLCFEYDLYHGESPEQHYEGLSLYEFFRKIDDEGYTDLFSHVWKEELEEHRKKEQKEAAYREPVNPLGVGPGGKEPGTVKSRFNII